MNSSSVLLHSRIARHGRRRPKPSRNSRRSGKNWALSLRSIVRRSGKSSVQASTISLIARRRKHHARIRSIVKLARASLSSGRSSVNSPLSTRVKSPRTCVSYSIATTNDGSRLGLSPTRSVNRSMPPIVSSSMPSMVSYADIVKSAVYRATAHP